MTGPVDVAAIRRERSREDSYLFGPVLRLRWEIVIGVMGLCDSTEQNSYNTCQHKGDQRKNTEWSIPLTRPDVGRNTTWAFLLARYQRQPRPVWVKANTLSLGLWWCHVICDALFSGTKCWRVSVYRSECFFFCFGLIICSCSEAEVKSEYERVAVLRWEHSCQHSPFNCVSLVFKKDFSIFSKFTNPKLQIKLMFAHHSPPAAKNLPILLSKCCQVWVIVTCEAAGLS